MSPHRDGELSKVFSYRKGDADYVIHFKDNEHSLHKVFKIYDMYGEQSLPIPRIHKVGRVENIHFSISDRVSGTPISALEPTQIRALIPDIVHQFMRIRQVHVADSHEGYGWITRKARLSIVHGWTTSRLFSMRSKKASTMGGTICMRTAFWKRVFEEIYQTMIERVRYSPPERYLVHGDFHLGNMLGENENVTGIVDWEMAMFGDFMLDVSVLHMWYPMLEFPSRSQKPWSKA